jgi:hypothetical protein
MSRLFHSISDAGAAGMLGLTRRWERQSRFGDLVVIGFLIVQALDGTFTYLGVHIWGLHVEANPLISAAAAAIGPGAALTTAKLMAAAFGIALHLNRIHTVVFALTTLYIALAILPWTALFLSI